MKKTLIIAFTLLCSALTAQDTICVMVTLNEVIKFNYHTSEVIDRLEATDDITLTVANNQVLCLHLYDGKKRFRSLTITSSDGRVSDLDNVPSKDDVYYTVEDFNVETVRVSKPRPKR
jgi:antitoxin (DNA-binding transcriptional repressor) of toxin-antitoxin stability system